MSSTVNIRMLGFGPGRPSGLRSGAPPRTSLWAALDSTPAVPACGPGESGDREAPTAVAAMAGTVLRAVRFTGASESVGGGVEGAAKRWVRRRKR